MSRRNDDWWLNCDDGNGFDIKIFTSIFLIFVPSLGPSKSYSEYFRDTKRTVGAPLLVGVWLDSISVSAYFEYTLKI